MVCKYIVMVALTSEYTLESANSFKIGGVGNWKQLSGQF